MTDLWDEKPKAVKVYESYADDYYHVEEMDAWLEKVKVELSKLEAIEKLFLPLPEWVEWEESPMHVESSKMLELKKILQSSTQKVG